MSMDLNPATALVYLRHGFDQLLRVADRLGDEALNTRPLGQGTNAVAALIVHCCGVTEFWLGHVALGEPSNRDRTAELSATGTLSELHVIEELFQHLGHADLTADFLIGPSPGSD